MTESSTFRGVYQYPDNRSGNTAWVSVLRGPDGKEVSRLGPFQDEWQAARAWDSAVDELSLSLPHNFREDGSINPDRLPGSLEASATLRRSKRRRYVRRSGWPSAEDDEGSDSQDSAGSAETARPSKQSKTGSGDGGSGRASFDTGRAARCLLRLKDSPLVFGKPAAGSTSSNTSDSSTPRSLLHTSMPPSSPDDAAPRVTRAVQHLKSTAVARCAHATDTEEQMGYYRLMALLFKFNSPALTWVASLLHPKGRPQLDLRRSKDREALFQSLKKWADATHEATTPVDLTDD